MSRLTRYINMALYPIHLVCTVGSGLLILFVLLKILSENSYKNNVDKLLGICIISELCE